MVKYVVDIKNLTIFPIQILAEKQRTFSIKINGIETTWLKSHKNRYIKDTEKEAISFMNEYIKDRIKSYTEAIEFLKSKINHGGIN